MFDLTSQYEVGEIILARIAGALEAAGRAEVTTSYVGAGQIAWDDCCGQLVVNPERIYRYVEFPNEMTDAEAACYVGEMALVVSIVLLRCVSVLSDSLEPPSEDSLREDHARIHADATVIWGSVNGSWDEYGWQRAQVSQAFIGAEGGCIAIETRLTLGLGQDDWC